MKYLILLIPLSFLVIFLLFFTKQNKQNFKSNFDGVVFSSFKEKKGFYRIQLRGHSKIFTISYRGRVGIMDIQIGDSIYKENNSNIVYKKYENKGSIEELIESFL